MGLKHVSIIADDTYSCKVCAKKFNFFTHKDGNNSRGMPEQQGDSSELSRNPCTDKPWQQSGTNMDGNFQEIMDILYNLMSRMATPN